MKNWKSTLSFILFIGIFLYSIVSVIAIAQAGAVISSPIAAVVSTSGWIAATMAIAMMFRSDMNSELIAKLIDSISSK